MKKTPVAFTSILLLIGTVFAAAALSTPAHAASSGVVCILPDGDSGCSSAPATITGSVGSQLRVSIFIQDSSGINGFDATVLADRTILRPAGIDLTGTVLIGTPSIIVECLSGVIVSGSVCQPTDTVDTIELAATSALGSGITNTPTTGLLFTAIYNITGSSSGTPISFQTGCTNTSVSGGVCVTIANGTPMPVPETVQTALFTTSTTPDFAMSASPASQTVTPGSSAFSTITLVSLNGFNGSVVLSLPPECLAIFCPTWSISPSTVELPAGGAASSTLTFGTTFQTTGTWGVTVTGTNGGVLHNLTATFAVVSPPPPDFSIATNPTSLSVVAGSLASSTVTLSSLNGFNGTVSLAATISPVGPSILITQPDVTLLSGATGTTTLLVSTTNSTNPGTYSIIVTGTGGTVSHTAAISLTVTGVASTGVGVVCFVQSDATSCQSSFTGSVGTQLRVSIFIQGSNGLNGFDVILLADYAVLRPAGVDLTGSVLQTPTIVIECLSGVLISGSICSSNDTIDTLELAATHIGALTNTPTTGLLFTAIYNVTGNSSGTPISFQTGCSNTSVSGGVCVTISNGTSSPVPETVLLFSSLSTPDFQMSANPASQTVAAGSSTFSTISLTSSLGFEGTVSLAATISPVGPSILITQPDVTLLSGATGTTTLLVSTTNSTSLGSYSITVTGASGTISHMTTMSLTVTGITQADFTISDSATSIAIPVGSERQTIVTVSSVNGFSGNVQLVAKPSSTAFACWFTTLTNTSTVFVPSGGFANQFPTCGAGRPAGAYTLTITGTSGSLSHAVTLSVNITDFSISGPASISFNAGSSDIEGLTFSSLTGFAGTIALNVTFPSGLSTSCPSSVTLTSGGTSTVICSLASSTPGTYNVTFTGTFVCSDCYYDGKDVNSLTTIVTVFGTGTPDFALSANPSTITFAPGSAGTSTIAVTALNGFSGIVSLAVTASSGTSATISPTSINSQGTATLTVTGSLSGTFSVQVTGASGSISHSITLLVSVTSVGVVCIVQSGSTSCPVSPASLTGAVGTQLRVAVFVQGSGGLNGFDVTLLADHTILRPVGIDLTGTVLVGTPNIVVECLSGVLISGSTCTSTDTIDTIELAATSALGSGITSTPTTGLLFTAIYNITGTTSETSLGFQAGCSNTSVSGGVCVTVANGSIVLVPETVESATFSNGVSQPDFSVTASPSSLSLGCTGSATSTVTLSSVNGFNGTVSLALNIVPVGVSATLSPTTVTLLAGGLGTSTLTVNLNGASAGTYQIMVTGTSGLLTHSTVVSVVVTLSPCFAMTASPTSITMNPGQTGTSTITIAALNGFTGSIVLSASSPTGLSTSLNPTSVMLGGTATSVLTISSISSTPLGTYTITVTGTSGSTSQSVIVSVTIAPVSQPDFSLSANPSSVTIAPSTSGTSTITVSALNGFSGVVSLTVTASSGITATLSPASITGSGTSTLTVTGSTSGAFSVQIMGVSGSIAHSLSVPVMVTSAGLICIVQSDATSCPVSSASLTGAAGTQLRVAVFIQNSGGLNGFDVTLLADHTILRPAGVDLTGTVLVGTPTIVVECLSGVLISGSTCTSTDTIDTIELAATSALGSGITSTPTSGLLFTAIYNITGTTLGITLGFQTGCSNTSVSGGVCVTIANGTPIPVPETVQSAIFGNSLAAPDFSIAASPVAITTTVGTVGSSIITVSSVNGFTGTVTLTSSSPVGLACTLNPTSIALGSSQTSTLLCTGSAAGTYAVTVTGMSGSLSHSVTVTVTVTLTVTPDFTITATPTTQTIIKGGSATYTITIKGSSGFNGTVSLSTTISPVVKNGPTISLPTRVGPYSNSTLTVSTIRSTAAGTYTITVTATSGSITHRVAITVIVVTH